MLLTEWNLKDSLEVAREEAEAKGIEKVFSLLDSGMSLEDAKRQLGQLQ